MNKIPVIFVNGMASFPLKIIEPYLVRYLRKMGLSVFSLNLGLVALDNIPILSQKLSQKLQKLRQEAGIKQYNIIGYSLGGLIAFAMLNNFKSERRHVKKLITLGSPFYGSPIADLLCFFGFLIKSIPEITTQSPILKDLRTKSLPKRINFYCLAALFDILSPPFNSFHPKSQFILLPGHHLSLVTSLECCEIIYQLLNNAYCKTQL